MEHQSQPSSSSSPPSAALEDCLKLLGEDTDEQRLAGLLLVTKFCKQDDHASIRRVYLAIPPVFLNRLLRTGMRTSTVPFSDTETDNREAYLHLCLTVLAAFCRVPNIAASPDMLSKIPLIMQIMEKELAPSVLEPCLEFLFLTCSNDYEGFTTLFESGGLGLITLQLPSLSDGSHVLELSMRLVRLIFSRRSVYAIVDRHLNELVTLVPFIARQFALSQNAVKFDLLQLLCVILSSDQAMPLHTALCSKLSDQWPAYVRAGVVDILQNRVGPGQKLQGLIVAESMVSLLGEGWLIDQMNVPDLHRPSPSDRCLLLVLESARVEIAVLLNELAYTKFEAETDVLPSKIRDLAVAYSLIEKVVKLISNIDQEEGGIVSEGTMTKVISGLNKTLEVVLEYLQDSKDHGQKKGDDLLASVRVAGSYLSEAPLACQEKVKELLSYLLSVEGKNESSSFLSVCFMLPFLCQATMTVEGVMILASSGTYKTVLECLVQLIQQDPLLVEDSGCMFLACDTVLNFLLKREDIQIQLDESAFVHVLKALAYWMEGTCDSSIIIMASSISSLILEAMSEEVLLQHPAIDIDILRRLSQLISESLTICKKEMCNGDASHADLHQIIASGYSRWSKKFPVITQAVE